MKQLTMITTHRITKGESREIILDQSGEVVIELAGEGAEADIRGVFQARDRDSLAISVTIHHLAPHTKAKTTMKGTVADEGRLSFRGKIIIDENCPGCQSFLTERILILSDKATAEAIPELEILSDDVSCSHAASIAKISETQLFYLQSRGISRESAIQLLADCFLIL